MVAHTRLLERLALLRCDRQLSLQAADRPFVLRERSPAVGVLVDELCFDAGDNLLVLEQRLTHFRHLHHDVRTHPHAATNVSVSP